MEHVAIRKLGAVAVCLALSSCLQNVEKPGPENGSEKHLISGRLFYENGSPVAGAHVTIRPSDFIPATSGAFAKRAADTLVVRTDGKGEFFIDSIGTGSYVLEGRDETDFVGIVEPVSI